VTAHDQAIDILLDRDPLFARCIEAGGRPAAPALRTPAGFPGLLRIILEQQVSVYAAESMWRKLCTAIEPVTPEALLALDEGTLRSSASAARKWPMAADWPWMSPKAGWISKPFTRCPTTRHSKP